MENLFNLKNLSKYYENEFIEDCQKYINDRLYNKNSIVYDEANPDPRPIHLSLLDLAVSLGFSSLKELNDYVDGRSEYVKRVYARVKSIIENNHIKNITKDPKFYNLSVTLLQNDHSWVLKPTSTTLNENVTTIKLDYDKNFSLVASQFDQQMSDTVIKALEDSVKTLPLPSSSESGEKKK